MEKIRKTQLETIGTTHARSYFSKQKRNNLNRISRDHYRVADFSWNIDKYVSRREWNYKKSSRGK